MQDGWKVKVPWKTRGLRDYLEKGNLQERSKTIILLFTYSLLVCFNLGRGIKEVDQQKQCLLHSSLTL